MTQTQQQIEKLRTLQESYNVVADAIQVQLPALADKIDNIDLTPIENKVEEGVNSLATKIDNIDFSNIAKQGNNEDATNTKILEEINNVQHTFDSLDIPLSAISGLALELEGGKKNVVNALKARGVEASVESDTLTDLAEKVYEVKNPVAFTVPAETSNECADVMFNTMMKSQGYDKMYAEVVETYCGEGGTYVGCLMSVLSKSTNTTIELSGADAYYIYEENKFYKTDDDKNLVQIINGVETQLGTKKHLWDDTNFRDIRTVLYLYLPNSSADGKREQIHVSYFDYCFNTIIPIIELKNVSYLSHFHIANVENCKIIRNKVTNDKCLYFYTNSKKFDGFKSGSYTAMYFNSEEVQYIHNSQVLSNSKIKNIEFPNLIELSCDDPNIQYYILASCNNVERLSFPKLQKINISRAATYGGVACKLPSLTTLKFPVLKECVIESGGGGITLETPNLTNVEFPALEIIDMVQNGNGLLPTKLEKLESLYLPSLKQAKGSRATLGVPIDGPGTAWKNLKYIFVGCIGDRTQSIKLGVSFMQDHEIDIEIGQNARQRIVVSKISLKADTIVPHILNKLADNNFEDDGVTPAPAIQITLGSVNLAKLTDEQKAIATDKNYILA